MRRRLVTSVVLAVVLSGRAAADPVTHLKTPSTVKTDGGTDLRLPPGYFLDEPNWAARDREFRRLQDAETRYKAENQSLRSTVAGWQPGWVSLGLAFVAGVSLGVYATGKL